MSLLNCERMSRLQLNCFPRRLQKFQITVTKPCFSLYIHQIFFLIPAVFKMLCCFLTLFYIKAFHSVTKLSISFVG